jgi:hypothetical protein
MAITNYAEVAPNGQDYINGIEYVHPLYEKYAPLWVKARDVIAGESQLKSKAKRELYLTRLGGHTNTAEGNADYNAFVNYAMLYNATGRTVDAYRGLLNRKLPSISVPEADRTILDKFTIKGESIYTFIEQLEVEIITTNRVGIFIDFPRVDTKLRSRADVAALNLAPYATTYSAENILNWEESRVNNKIVTSLVVLREINYVHTAVYTPQKQVTYRVLELDDEGYYRQVIIVPTQIVKGNIKQTYNVVQDIIYPKHDGKKMREIPFIPITAQGATWELSKSIIDDLINVNLAHYRDTAFFEKAIAWTASPTAVFSGIPEDIDNISIGSSQAILIAQGGTAKYLEYEGKGLEDIANALKAKEDLMAILGAKILANTASKVESGEAAMIHRAGEQGILADIATTIGLAVERTLFFILNWKGTGVSMRDITVDITKDFTPTAMEANMVIALGNELERGGISYESYIWALQRGELLPSTRTATEELELINSTREGTLIGKDSKVTYLEKTRVNAILDREEKLVDLKKSKGTVTEAQDASTEMREGE